MGLGWVSSQYIKSFKAVDQYGLGRCEVYLDLERMLEKADLDLVCILTPNYLHASQAIQCAEAGKHLVIEKPAALN